MVIMVTVFIEGSANDKNGNLRQGFGMLFEQRIKKRTFKIVLGDDKHATIRKFKGDKLSGKKVILIDLDAGEETRDEQIKKLGLDKAQTFFMIQELEAWFISQSEILDSYYNVDIKSKVQHKDPKKIQNPGDLLAQLTKNTKKGEYHKVRHATDLLKKLSLATLERSFEDVKKFVEGNA